MRTFYRMLIIGSPCVPCWRCLPLAAWLLSASACSLGIPQEPEIREDDPIQAIQTRAIAANRSEVAYWGADPEKYITWSTHSNRLIPIYTYGTRNQGSGIDLASYTGEKSIYRREADLRTLYGYLPEKTLRPEADYCDQTDLYRLQKAALDAGKRYIILIIFDGMDWQCSQAAAVANGAPLFTEGKGSGLHFIDYDAQGTAEFGYMVTAPYDEGGRANVDNQTVANVQPGGGYDPDQGGWHPWSLATEPRYLQGTSGNPKHPYTDSSSSATSLTAGIKTYNAAVNVDPEGKQVETIAHQAQAKGYSVGVITSVTIPHATPAAAYAHNVHRSDYQDLARDMVGLPSVAHPSQPLAGMDLILGTGYGIERASDPKQGTNYVPGNQVLTAADLDAIRVERGGRYVVSQRTQGESGAERLRADARQASAGKHRLLGFYGTRFEHLPFRTANGDFQPTWGLGRRRESYSPADLLENPTLAEMTEIGLEFLQAQQKPFWLMIEAGDVDWANHQNNLDDMIGAILSGDDAVRQVTDWVEANSSWEETVVIVTADHGHHLHIKDLRAFVGGAIPKAQTTSAVEVDASVRK